MSKKVKVGNLIIGGGSPVSVQSMTTTRPADVFATVNQIIELENAGCDIVRFCVRDDADAIAIKEIKKQTKIPLVADIHFDYRLAIKSIDNGADKIRINPGNIGSEDNVKEVATALKRNNIPVRVGSNTGSIEKEFLLKYGKSEVSLGESAFKSASILEKHGVTDIILSVKASDVNLMMKSYKYVAERCDYPLHLGVTEAGTLKNGIIKNSVGIGSLLACGIGDTIRVSLSAPPVEEVYAGKGILRALGLESNYAEIVACPTCGRCDWDCMAFAEKVEKFTANVNKRIKIAVMGCVVNGPGEAADADIGIAGGKDCCLIFKKGKPYKKVGLDKVEEEFFKEIQDCLK